MPDEGCDGEMVRSKDTEPVRLILARWGLCEAPDPFLVPLFHVN